MFKILFITTSFDQKANSAAIRNNAWVNGLSELGCNVTVYTVNWPKQMRSSFLIENSKAKIERTDLSSLEMLNITASSRVRQLPGWVCKVRHFIRDIIYFPDICKSWKKQIKCNDFIDYDIVISSSDAKSSHLAAYELLKKNKSQKKWVQIWGDPWGSDINIGITHKIPAKIYEKHLIGKADYVIYVSELTKKYIQQQYPQFADKIHYIPRGYYKEIPKKTSSSEKYTICYTGVLSNGRIKRALPLISAVEEWNKQGSVKILMEFYGNYDTETIGILKGFEACRHYPNIDFEEVIEHYSTADVLLFISNGANSTQIPGKFYDYMGTQLPIICVLSETEISLSSMLSEYERCVIVNKNSDYRHMIKTLISNKNRVYDINTEFSPKTIAARFLEIVK